MRRILSCDLLHEANNSAVMFHSKVCKRPQAVIGVVSLDQPLERFERMLPF
jgi:hypothetical protein